MIRRPFLPLLVLAASFLLVAPASAAPPPDRLALVTSWTRPAATSAAAWADARAHPGRWAAYGLDWSTDHCSASPDRPFGLDFRLPCARHDFGYRNLTALGAFAAGRARVDAALHADLRAVCARQHRVRRHLCTGLAELYYRVVRGVGGLGRP